ncbi:hypothetical protein NP233_g3867 [Leucocoprinus birnbaumii]|uniref:F-box domain-containing protein n=1 Tax=Leucocoprinus birnbaumii TaxID=56174 RepID=A0AAD5VWG6_9AGAR|nr:hypothetical protein NP233_g3867 [Leucocoprinus birnbaumii]
MAATFQSLPEDILFAIFSKLRGRDLAAVRTITKRSRKVASKALYHIVLRILRHSMANPIELLAKMREADAVISGSAVLHAMDYQTFSPNDLDIYVPSERVEIIGSFLVSSGFSLAPDRPLSGSPYSIRTLKEVRRYVINPSDAGDMPATEVNLLSTRARSPFIAIVNFDMTGLMNVITARSLLSLYPLAIHHFSTIVARHLID